MGAFKPDPEILGHLITSEEMERRRSGAQRVATPVTLPPPEPGPTVTELRDRYVLLVAAREHSPERLTPVGLAVFEAHEKVAVEYMATDGEEIYQQTTSGYLMRQRLREILPDWFSGE